MPIYLREDKKNQASPGSSISDTNKLKQVISILQERLNFLTKSIKQLKAERTRAEMELARLTAENNRLKADLQRITRGRRGGGHDFGDF